jgi:hypothetical protein
MLNVTLLLFPWLQYYCAGSIEAHWASLGYPHVIHRNRDFYADIESGNIPEFDVLVTNPP